MEYTHPFSGKASRRPQRRLFAFVRGEGEHMPRVGGPEVQGQQAMGVRAVRPDQEAPGGALRAGESRGALGSDVLARV